MQNPASKSTNKNFPTSIFMFLNYFCRAVVVITFVVSSSQAMEKEGVIQCLTDILDNFQLDIEVITTDRQT